ncbi:uncharacterized protein LOC123676451 [Harmonia axyridis]|uniref:uncharacterized protein LOC123676451 n=1 Tax=Harmonia axyridis TaxID=115357 RepID=UPI001E277C59|nr:uncharacterized protein LOC123676451 [Harmonia axyridis]XP_045468307.1 uncharacterized protein LOC123676451 [Harmonia axyridis]
MLPEEFITKFHQLEGVTLKEKKKSLHNLLQILKNASSDTIDLILQELKPTSYLEETFKIEILLIFKRSNDLINILKDGNEIEASKIIKQSWFIKELVKTFTPDRFVQDLFPHLSLSIRTKILKKILVYIKDEELIKNLFETLCSAYGWQVSSILLTGCPDEKIKEMLEKNLCWLSSSQLKLLLDKNPSLVTFYFEMMKQEESYLDNYKWRSFFDYIVTKDPIFFDEFGKKFNIYKRNFGRQTTKKFLLIKKDEIMADPNKYISFLRNDALVRKLGDNFPEFYKKALPKDLYEFQYCNAKSLMKYYRKSKQYQLYFNAFQEIYKKSLWENSDYMDERLIELIPDKEERVNWLKKFEKRSNYEKYTDGAMMARCAMKCSTMEFDEEDYMLGDENGIAERKTVFNTLITTCKLNKDYDTLVNILKSFCQRHRNSDVSILYNFLRCLYDELEMKKLTGEHWKYINEIITVQLFKKQKMFYPIFMEYIRFLRSQNQPIDELVLTLLKEIPQKLVDFKYNDDSFEKSMLELYIKYYPQVTDDKKLNLIVQIILSVMNWNKKHPNNPISLHDQQNILSVFSVLKDKEKLDKSLSKAFKYLVCRQKEGQESSILDEVYWHNFKNLKDTSITKWFLKYKPEILKNNLNKVGIMLENKDINLVHNLKKYEHIEIPNDITKLCLKELEDAEPSKRERVIKILVYFMPSRDFQKFFQQYIPKTDRVDTAGGSEDIRKSYEIQCALAKYLKNRIHLDQNLQDLLKYCRGDVLPSALPSVYSSFCRIPEKLLYPALEELGTKAVSTRKHSIFLTSLICPIDKVMMKYNQVEQLEKNVSVRQHMFLSCYKYYLRNNIEKCWPLLSEYIGQLKKEQKDILKLITNVHKVPIKHRAVFTECVWEKLCKVKKDGVKMDDNMASLLSNLNPSDIKLLREEFAMSIIENYLFDLDDCSMNDTVFNFTNYFLLFSGNTEKKVKFIFECIHKLKEMFWNDDEKKINILKIISKFCFNIFKKMLKRDTNGLKYDENLPKIFSAAWKREFTIEETFEEHIFLDFIVIHTASDSNSDSLPKEMSEYFSSTLEKYGNLIIGNFKYFLTFFLSLIYKDDDHDLQVLKFLDNFLDFKDSPEHCALVIDLLPNENHKEDVQEAYKKLLKKLFEKDQIIKICLYGKLKENSIGYY